MRDLSENAAHWRLYRMDRTRKLLILHLDALEAQVIEDALLVHATTMDDVATSEAAIADEVRDRLKNLTAVADEWTRQWARLSGLGRSKNRPQG